MNKDKFSTLTDEIINDELATLRKAQMLIRELDPQSIRYWAHPDQIELAMLLETIQRDISEKQNKLRRTR